MCGIAGIIYRDGDGQHRVGRDMTAMLQAMKHRGPDSTGYALYRPNADGYVMHVKVAEGNGNQDFEFAARLRRHREEVEARIKALGARIGRVDKSTDHAMTVTFDYDGDLKQLADYVEDVRGAEVLSLGRSLEIVKDLGDASTVATDYRLDDFVGTHAIGHARMATESDVDIAKGDSLEDAMRRSLADLDGVFTYICVTEDALGVAKDELGAKPLVLYESDEIVALASEEIAIRKVIDREIETYDPYEGAVMVWTR